MLLVRYINERAQKENNKTFSNEQNVSIMDFEAILISLGIFLVLPVCIVSLITRVKINETNKRSDLALAAIERNSDVDLKDFFKKNTPPPLSIKERLLKKLQYGCIFTLLGAGIFVTAIVFKMNAKSFAEDAFMELSFAAVSLMCIGIAFLINYFVGRKALKQEIEAEAKKQA